MFSAKIFYKTPMRSKTFSESNLFLFQRILKIISGIVLIFACSQISLPLEPVPITLQTVAVMLIGLTYSKSDGLISMIAYVLAGTAGLPVFANFASGITSPSSGYLFGFIAAVYVMNQFKEKFGLRSFLSIIFACVLGNIILFAVGIAWLSTFIGISGAITHGLMPFVAPGLIKACLLSASLKVIGFKR